MKIADSTINMFSGRNFSASGMKAGKGVTGGAFLDMANFYSSKKGNTGVRDSYESGMGSYNMNDINYFKGLSKVSSAKTPGVGQTASAFQNMTLSAIFRRFASFGMMGGAGIGGLFQNTVTYAETEETAFHACGQARTEDGRTIDFNVDILMSRSYMEYMNVQIPTMGDALFDPLIVNIGDGSNAADVRDQTFKFDLDADGKEDEISMLGKGSGFLALDKDGNGKIDDGNELFGTKSGDGFGDLREYDSDGNGWIDENDEVFSKLKVWCKDENGSDVLMDLKQADIGAIYLGEQQTEFTMGGNDGIRDGVIRSTGIFLRESGSVSTIQHLDLAMKQGSTGEQVSGEETVSYMNTSENRSGQSNATRQNEESRAERRREESRRRNERAMKRRADRKADEELRMKKLMERRRYEERLQEQRYAENL